jgi:epoxyqueuosine reductase
MIDPVQLKEAIKEKARQLGFLLAGVTSADPQESFPVFRDWVAAGRQASMDYLATERSLERRADLKAILPECRSVLVLAAPYSPPEPESAGVAAYALGEDYHDVLVPRLAEIAAFIEKQVGEPVPCLWYTDTGPILERDLARRAGLGWIGKNSMLINPGAGSYFLLAEILLGIELPPDEPFTADHCGSCTRCLDACPTSCIRPDRTLEAGRCISFLTIENKGEIPLDLRELVGKWQFGCDVCQQVCPWNRFAGSGDAAFDPRPGVPPEDLVEELTLTPREFNRKFKGSAVKRAKRRGYLRNTSVVLGNRGNETAMKGLIPALGDFEPLVRAHAAWALGQIGGKESRAALRSALAGEGDMEVVAEIRRALGE